MGGNQNQGFSASLKILLLASLGKPGKVKSGSIPRRGLICTSPGGQSSGASIRKIFTRASGGTWHVRLLLRRSFPCSFLSFWSEWGGSLCAPAEKSLEMVTSFWYHPKREGGDLSLVHTGPGGSWSCSRDGAGRASRLVLSDHKTHIPPCCHTPTCVLQTATGPAGTPESTTGIWLGLGFILKYLLPFKSRKAV